MKKNAQTRLVAIALAALVASAAVAPRASADSSIRVLVNDEAITSFDIAQRTKLMAMAREKGGIKEATEQLINEVIEIADAKKHGIVISDARIDQAYIQISKNIKQLGTPERLTQALASQGVIPDTLKRRLRAQMAWGQVVQAKSRVEASVKSSDVTKALLADNQTDNKMETTEFTLQQILFVVPKGSSPGYFAQRRREAEGFRLRFAGCDKSIDQAKGLKDVVVRNIGRRT